MKTSNILSTIKALAYAIITLGIIHEAATYSPLIKGGLTCLDKGNMDAMLYMSLICGASLILSGIIILMLLKHVENHAFLTQPILVLGAFLAVNGILSVIYMFDNPFAWLALLLNLAMFWLTFILKKAL
jgi:uncharacterized membrane protein HdeD (DUF308 family)